MNKDLQKCVRFCNVAFDMLLIGCPFVCVTGGEQNECPPEGKMLFLLLNEVLLFGGELIVKIFLFKKGLRLTET